MRHIRSDRAYADSVIEDDRGDTSRNAATELTVLAAEARARLATQFRTVIAELGASAPAALRAAVEAQDWDTANREYQRWAHAQVGRAAAEAESMKAAAEREREGAEFWTAFMAAAPPESRPWIAAATLPWDVQAEMAAINFEALDPGAE